MRLSSPEDSIQGAWLIVETSTGMFLPVTAKSCLFARKKLMDMLDEEEGMVVGWEIGHT